MNDITYQPYLTKGLTTVSDGDNAMYLNDTSVMTGLPPDTLQPDWWGAAATDFTAGESYSYQGSGVVLLYSADKRLLMHYPAALFMHLPVTKASLACEGITVHGLRRSWTTHAGQQPRPLGNLGLEAGTTISPPMLTYAVVAQHHGTATPSAHQQSVEATVQATGVVASACFLLDCDAHGKLPYTAELSELFNTRPTDITLSDSSRELAWLDVPIGKVGALSLSNASVVEGARLVIKDAIRFYGSLADAGRADAAWLDFKQRTADTGLTYEDGNEGGYIFADNAVLDRGTVATTPHGGRATVIDASGSSARLGYRSGVISALRVPDTGKYYAEVELHVSLRYMISSITIALTDTASFRNWGGAYGLPPCDFSVSVISKSSMDAYVALLIDRQAGTVTFRSLTGNAVARTSELPIASDRIAILLQSYRDDDTDTLELSLLTTDAEFRHPRPEGYECLPPLMNRRHQPSTFNAGDSTPDAAG